MESAYGAPTVREGYREARGEGTADCRPVTARPTARTGCSGDVSGIADIVVSSTFWQWYCLGTKATSRRNVRHSKVITICKSAKPGFKLRENLAGIACQTRDRRWSLRNSNQCHPTCVQAKEGFCRTNDCSGMTLFDLKQNPSTYRNHRLAQEVVFLYSSPLGCALGKGTGQGRDRYRNVCPTQSSRWSVSQYRGQAVRNGKCHPSCEEAMANYCSGHNCTGLTLGKGHNECYAASNTKSLELWRNSNGSDVCCVVRK